jgi:hypothetical protein
MIEKCYGTNLNDKIAVLREDARSVAKRWDKRTSRIYDWI